MDKNESLALFAKGRGEWNKWANGKLAEKARLEETGEWEANRLGWKYGATVDFSGHTFSKDADFRELVFPSDIYFDRAIFLGDVSFFGTVFHGMASFTVAEFCGDANFGGVTFPEKAAFDYTTFFGLAKFIGATFQQTAKFEMAKFIAKSDQPNAIAFAAQFAAMKSEKFFNLYNARFEQVPDFVQAHFLEAPNLDTIVIGPKARENPTRPATNPPSPHGEPVEPREGGKRQAAILRQAQDEGKRQAQDEARLEAKQIPSRWRHLRRLATQGQDHENEANFFAEELKSQRNVFDFPKGENWQRYWAGYLYQLFSDFGRSITRPFCWWLGGVAFYAVALLTAHDFIAKIRPPFELGHNGCFLGDSTPWSTALKVAFDNALFLPQLGVSNAQVQENLCLFGYDTGLKMPNLPPVPLVPTWIAGLGAFHAVFSLIMVFLILLAIRNQFRIR